MIILQVDVEFSWDAGGLTSVQLEAAALGSSVTEVADAFRRLLRSQARFELPGADEPMVFESRTVRRFFVWEEPIAPDVPD